jgi:hypothetical protein
VASIRRVTGARPWTTWASPARSPVRAPPPPIQAGRHWPIERTDSWINGYGKLRRITDRNAKAVEFYLYLAAAFVTVRELIQRVRRRYRRDPRSPPSGSSDTPVARRS